MSAETASWLNTMTLIGFTEKRGNAWHYRESEQGTEPNHYPHAIPVPDLERRLFGWKPVVAKVKVSGRAGGKSFTKTDETRKAIVHPDSQEILGIVGKDYKIHGYQQWLVENAKAILDAPELGVGSAGLLKEGAVAWVQIEMDETIEGPGGITHRPFFTSATTLDGQMSTTYQMGTQLVVCDNTLSAALREGGADRIKVRHRSGSLGRIGDVRQRLQLMYENADEVNAELDELLNVAVSDADWDRFLDAHLGKRPFESGRGQTNYDSKRDELAGLYSSDPRVAPWKGTGFGVIQAVNTHAHHVRTVKGMDRAQRNMTNMVTGQWDKLDTSTLTRLQAVLAA
jgi:phage/plasmid-like protein (TIGR03299 family)